MKKRTLALFTALVMAGGLTGCSSNESASAPPQQQKAADAPGTSEAYPSKTIEVILPFGAGAGSDLCYQ